MRFGIRKTPRTPRRRVFLGFGGRVAILATTWLSIVLCGCGEDAFTPPRPFEAKAVVNRPPDFKPYSVELILPPVSTRDNETYVLIVRREADRDRSLFRLTRPQPEDAPGRQAELIQVASKREHAVLIVEPVDDPKVAEAIADARNRDVPVVTLGRRLPAGDPSKSKSVPSVVFASIDEDIRRLADLVLKDVAKARLPVDGRVLILAKSSRSRGVDEVIASIKSALAKAGVRETSVIDVSGDQEVDGREVAAKLAADPKIVAAFALESDGANAATIARGLAKPRIFRVGGVMSADTLLPPAVTDYFAGILDRNVTTLAREGFRTAMDLARGKTVPDLKQVPVRLVPRAEVIDPDAPPEPPQEFRKPMGR